MKRLTTAAATLASLLLMGTAASAEDERAVHAQQQIQQTLTRLELTDEQIDQVEPVLRESAAARQEILAKYGMDPESRQNSTGRPGLREMRAMRQEMEDARRGMLSELAPILSDEQLEELKLIQEERRVQMREQIRGVE